MSFFHRIGCLQEAQYDIFHILAHIAGFREVCGVRHGKGDPEYPGQGLGKEGLSGAGRAQEQDVALLHLHVARFAHCLYALVVVIDRHRQDLLGPFLAYYVFVEDILYS
jgi:hypothetical protein